MQYTEPLLEHLNALAPPTMPGTGDYGGHTLSSSSVGDDGRKSLLRGGAQA